MRLDEIQVGETYRFKYEPEPGKVLSIDRVPEYGTTGRRVRKLNVEFPIDGGSTKLRYIPAREAVELQSDHEARERDREARLAPIREAEERLVNALNQVGNDYRLSASQGRPFNRTHLYFNRLQAVVDLAEVIELGVREREARAQMDRGLHADEAVEAWVDDPEALAQREVDLTRGLGVHRAVAARLMENRPVKEES